MGRSFMFTDGLIWGKKIGDNNFVYGGKVTDDH